jgi:hypothetical protein
VFSLKKENMILLIANHETQKDKKIKDSLRSILILCFHRCKGLPNDLFLSSSATSYIFLTCPLHAYTPPTSPSLILSPQQSGCNFMLGWSGTELQTERNGFKSQHKAVLITKCQLHTFKWFMKLNSSILWHFQLWSKKLTKTEEELYLLGYKAV